MHLGKKGLSQKEMKILERSKGDLKIAQELELYDQITEKIKNLEEKSELSDIEKVELVEAKQYLVKIKEMMTVPDDSVQVDVFVNDTRKGEISKSKFYTKSEPPVHLSNNNNSNNNNNNSNNNS